MYHFARLLLIWFFCLISVLLHELGHALGYRISSGKGGWRVIAGSGPEIIGSSKLVFRLIPAGGYFLPEEEAKTNKEKLMMLAGGPVVSLLQAVLYWAVCFCIFSFVQPESGLFDILFPTSKFLMFFNFFQFLFTVVPMRYRVVCRGYESDGLQVIHLLKHKKQEP